MRRLLAAFLVSVATTLPSRSVPPATPCPGFVAGWSQPYTGYPITMVSYDPISQLLYIMWNQTQATAYSNVPQSIIQTFSTAKNPMPVYQNYVAPRYHSLVLFEQNNCPIRLEQGGYLWAT